jgi:hypothetical protein
MGGYLPGIAYHVDLRIYENYTTKRHKDLFLWCGAFYSEVANLTIYNLKELIQFLYREFFNRASIHKLSNFFLLLKPESIGNHKSSFIIHKS